MLDDRQLRTILQNSRTIAMVGLSADPERDSYALASFLQRHGYRVIPVNPHLKHDVLGEKPYPTLRSVPDHVDIVSIFRRAEHVPAIVEDSVAICADVIWMPLGVINQAAAVRARAAGVAVEMDRCIAIEHRRLMHVPEGVLL